MISGLEAFAKKVLVEIPESSNNESYADDPQGLPQILYDGSFTSSVSVSVLDKGIYTSLFGGAITTAWRNEGASIVKVYADEFTLTTPPCETEGFFPNRVWCDDEGTAYVLLKFPKKNTWYDNPMSRDVIEDFMDVPGVDDLDDYAISIQTVARGSDLAFNINDGKPYYQWDAQTTLDHLKNHTEESATFSTFNLPICDLRTDGNFYGMEPKAIDDDDCGAEVRTAFPDHVWKLTNITLNFNSVKSSTACPSAQRPGTCRTNMGKFSGKMSTTSSRRRTNTVPYPVASLEAAGPANTVPDPLR